MFVKLPFELSVRKIILFAFLSDRQTLLQGETGWQRNCMPVCVRIHSHLYLLTYAAGPLEN